MPLAAAQMILGTPQVTANNPFKVSSISGAGNVWTDSEGLGSETYTEVWLSARPSEADRDYAYAYVEPIEIPPNTSLFFMLLNVNLQLVNELNATSGQFTVRFSESGTDFDASGIYLTLPDDQDLEADVGDWVGTLMEAHPSPGLVGAAEMRDFQTGDMADPAYVKALFGAGCYMVFTRLDDGEPIPYDHGIRVSEVIGSLWWVTPAGIPPLRGYPRDDRLRGSIRGFPTPTSRQHSARATGYL